MISKAEALAREEYRRAHVPLYNAQKLKLGVFGTNVSYGLNISHAPTTYQVTWEHTRAIVQRADAMGFELALPVARWRGFGGTTDFNGCSFETYTWAAGLAEATRSIMIAATSHVPTVHPIVAAKQATTIDHISNGRFALNLVMGWFTPEMAMFDGTQRPHDDRYRYGAEWLAIVKRLWTEEAPFDFDSADFHVRQAQAHPKPIQKPWPVLINAGHSPAATAFSAREVDFSFVGNDSLDSVRAVAKRMRDTARTDYGREVGICTSALVVCRETEAEARAVYRSIIDNGDKVAADNLMKVLGIESQSFNDRIEKYRERLVAGWGTSPIIGTPEQVTDQLGALSAAGVDGVVFGFLDYNEELKYFDEAVMPLLRQAGLRN
jgi:alkanesulfonate monooxygenase SsuD/methylene tetrahydromethanopterin reductase-like flavin-dependent oxidoreductase (luciferase family)